MSGAVTDLEVDVHEHDDVVVVALHGTLDLAAYERVRIDLVHRLRADGRDIVVDLGGLAFLDSTGLRLLIEVAALASRDRRRCAVVLPHDSPLRRIFTISATEDLLDLQPDVATARSLLG